TGLCNRCGNIRRTGAARNPTRSGCRREVALKLQCHGIGGCQQHACRAKGLACGPCDAVKIPRLHSSGWVTVEATSWSSGRVALVREEEKQLVLYDRPAHGATVIIPVLDGLGPCVIIETAGVE